MFRTPVRRLTRQRSGFNVAGNTPGSECKIRKSGRLTINDKEFSVTFIKKDQVIGPLFENEKGLICFGIYIKPRVNVEVAMTLKYCIEKTLECETRTQTLVQNQWNKTGALAEVKIIKSTKISFIECKLIIKSDSKIGDLDIFGINLGIIDNKYFVENAVDDIFFEKINIYIPEISYHQYDQIQHVESDPSLKFTSGDPIIIKSCNRCSRFLPIDVLNERNTLSYSNHCVKKAPCTHNAFSRYVIKETDYESLPQAFSQLLEDDRIKLYHGYQLECKSCKKFFVNAPLNPLRNSTQHREDSLRRRAIEVLVDTLLDREWIYHKFRLEQQREFDKHIWEKFGKKCFKCNLILKDEHEMDLDHTMPLASFWPLDEGATCLCKKCNSLKSDKFPIEFYSTEELKKLSSMSALPLEVLSKKSVNVKVIKKLIERIDWFFDDFLSNKDYQKIREGKRASDLIFKAILKQIRTFYDPNIDLVELYKKKTGKIPRTITL